MEMLNEAIKMINSLRFFSFVYFQSHEKALMTNRN